MVNHNQQNDFHFGHYGDHGVQSCTPMYAKVKIFLETMAYNHVHQWLPINYQLITDCHKKVYISWKIMVTAMMIKVKIFLVTNSNHDVHQWLPIVYRLSQESVHLGNHLSPEMIFFTLNIMVIIGVHDCTPMIINWLPIVSRNVYILVTNGNRDVHHELPFDYQLSPGCVHFWWQIVTVMVIKVKKFLVTMMVTIWLPIGNQLSTNCLKKVYISWKIMVTMMYNHVHQWLPIDYQLSPEMCTFLGKTMVTAMYTDWLPINYQLSPQEKWFWFFYFEHHNDHDCTNIINNNILCLPIRSTD